MLPDVFRVARPGCEHFHSQEMLDDYTGVLHYAGVTAAARMWSGTPRGTGETRVDAGFAAMAEYLARRDGWTVPAWARLPEREAWPWWLPPTCAACTRKRWSSRRSRRR